MNRYFFKIKVKGRGQFPLDQLRRFEMFPIDIESTVQIEESLTGLSRVREYTLGINSSNLSADGPCGERFKSFGFVATTLEIWKDDELFEKDGEVVYPAEGVATALELKGSINWEARS